MTSLSSADIIGLSGRARVRGQQLYFPTLCLLLLLSNVLTFLHHASASPLFNVLSNAVSLGLIAFSVGVLIRPRRNNTGGFIFLWLALSMAALSLLLNFPDVSLVEALKYLSIYIFFYVGRACGGRIRPIELYCIYALAALPIIFLITIGRSRAWGPLYEPFAHLANPNTAVLYFSALLFAVTQLYGKRILVLQFVNAALMNKIGALVATLVAIGLWVAFPLRRETVIALLAAAGGTVIAFTLGAFDRTLAALDNLALVFQLRPHTIASMSYGELVKLTGTTDLSAFFRLMHWSNIWELYQDQGSVTMLFGYGAGQTQFVTYAGMVPHNDYLRILAEYGPFNLLIFVLFLLYVWRSISASPGNVLFLVLCIYFASENLLDSFTSMAIFFAYAGRFTAESRLPSIRLVRSPPG